MALKAMVNDRIMKDIIMKVYKPNEWKVLILDRLSVRIVSSCCKMTNIMNKGITLVEDLKKKRQPLPSLEAVYFITPTEDSVHKMINDFEDGKAPRYKGAHIFFTETCGESLFKEICQSRISKFTRSIVEINIAFLPYESQVYTLDCPDSFEYTFSPNHQERRNKSLERIGEQLATLCAILGEYPAIRFKRYDNQQQAGGPGKQVLLDEDDDLWVSLRHQHIAVVSKSTSDLHDRLSGDIRSVSG